MTIFKVTWIDALGQRNVEFYKSIDDAKTLIKVLQQDHFNPIQGSRLPRLTEFEFNEDTGKLIVELIDKAKLLNFSDL